MCLNLFIGTGDSVLQSQDLNRNGDHLYTSNCSGLERPDIKQVDDFLPRRNLLESPRKSRCKMLAIFFLH